MKQVAHGLGYFHRSSHGYWKARSYFKGDLVREVFVTVFDKEKRATCQGYLFLCRGNALLTLLSDAGSLRTGIYEFTADDTFSVSETDDLTNILNKTTSTEKNLSVATSHKVAFVTVNGRYHLLHSIQVARTYGKSTLNWKTTYLVGDAYVDQAKALTNALSDVVKGKLITPTNLPGLKPATSLVMIYTATMVTPAVILILLYFFYLLFTGNLQLN